MKNEKSLYFRKWNFWTSSLKNPGLFWWIIVHFTASSLFVRYFVFLLLYCQCYGFERALFTSRRFLPYTPSCFYQRFHEASSSDLKVAGLLYARHVFLLLLFWSMLFYQCYFGACYFINVILEHVILLMLFWSMLFYHFNYKIISIT